MNRESVHHEQSHADLIASAVLSRFSRLPAKCKPRPGEWVPLAGIVIEDRKHDPPTYTAVSVATGMKCAPLSHLVSSQGSVLHDCHAEILSIRAFNRALLLDLQLHSPKWLTTTRNRHEAQPAWKLRPELRLHMYASTCPCGDASMEAVMGRQADAEPWKPADIAANDSCGPEPLLGRGHFDRLGIVRRKPARPDAPVAMSKSCSDKLAMSQCIGLLGSLASTLIDGRSVKLTSLVFPLAEVNQVSMDRAFGPGGRMAGISDWTRGGYSYTPFSVLSTMMTYDYRRPEGESKGSEKAIVLVGDTLEVVVGGVLQGRKRGDIRGASCVSRRALWQLTQDVAAAKGLPTAALDERTYGHVKGHAALLERRVAKQEVISSVLSGWTRTSEDLAWGL